ncbi:MAG: PEP-CTERM sorting domain-containing protein, partial [Candidatus Acidiferrales bacterium]
GAAYWLNLAALNYNPANDGNFEIVTNVGPVALTGQVQEFIVDTPEPATLLQLGVGVLALLFLARRKSLNSALQQNIA